MGSEGKHCGQGSERALAYLACLALLGFSGCAETRYTPLASGAQEYAGPFSPVRIVQYEKHPDLFERPLNCLLILPAKDDGVPSELRRIIDSAIASHFALRAPRIIDGARRDQMARYFGVAIQSRSGAKSLAEKVGCNGLAEIRVTDVDASYAVFVASFRLGLEIEVTRMPDGIRMWLARHTASRTEGGIPFGVGAVSATYSAANLAADPDAVHALVSDVTRRLFETWPVPGRTNALAIPNRSTGN